MRPLLLLVAAILTGCSVPKANLAADPTLTAAGQIVLGAAIRHGVADYLTQHPGSIGRTKAIAEEVLAVLNSDASTTLGALRELAYSKIPTNLPPLDQQDARSLIDLVALAVGKYVGEGQLDARAVVDLRDVLGTIAYAADHYAPGS